jgi:hypothetical protein
VQKEKPGAKLARAIGTYREEIVIDDKTISLSPLVLRQFADVLDCIDELRERGVVEVKDLTGKILQNVDPIKIMLRGGAPALRMLQIATALPSETINKLNLVDAANLFGAVFKVNLDFFVENQGAMTEAFSPLWTTIEELFPQVGQLLSNNSSPTATPSTPSVSTASPS